ncbi:unnamed protein product [Caenorhabditis nigoni]
MTNEARGGREKNESSLSPSDPPRSFWEIQVASGTFGKLLERLDSFRDIQEVSEAFRSVQEPSGTFPKHLISDSSAATCTWLLF